MDENRTFQASVYTGEGAARDAVALPGSIFDGTINMPVMHQAVKAYLANQRQGTAATKIRKYVIGGNQKPWRQKGTGRARQGSTRAPHWVGGGTVFGPQPRDYRQDLPKQVRALARKSALNARARENAILVIEKLEIAAPKTSRIKALLEQLGVGDQKVLILTAGVKPNVHLSARNIPNVSVMPYTDASTYHILWSDVLLIDSDALDGLESVDAAEEGEDSVAGEGTSTEAKAAKRSARGGAKREAAGGRKSAGAAKKSGAKKSAGTKAKAAGRSSAAAGKTGAKRTAAKTAKKAAPKKKGGK